MNTQSKTIFTFEQVKAAERLQSAADDLIRTLTADAYREGVPITGSTAFRICSVAFAAREAAAIVLDGAF